MSCKGCKIETICSLKGNLKQNKLLCPCKNCLVKINCSEYCKEYIFVLQQVKFYIDEKLLTEKLFELAGG
jgi:hypothetical protein